MIGYGGQSLCTATNHQDLLLALIPAECVLAGRVRHHDHRRLGAVLLLLLGGVLGGEGSGARVEGRNGG